MWLHHPLGKGTSRAFRHSGTLAYRDEAIKPRVWWPCPPGPNTWPIILMGLISVRESGEWSRWILARVNDTQIRRRLFYGASGSRLIAALPRIWISPRVGLIFLRSSSGQSFDKLITGKSDSGQHSLSSSLPAALSCKCGRNQFRTWRQPNEEKATTQQAPSPTSTSPVKLA